MTDYWSKLNINECWSEKQRYNFILNYVDSLVGEDAPKEEEPVVRNLSITVNDGKAPVSGATVSIGDVTGNTGSAGGCSLNGIPDGETTITVSKYGYKDYSGTIVVSEDNTDFTISLTRIVYDFVSYDTVTKDNEGTNGTAILTGNVSNGYSEIEIVTNSEEEMVGNKYYITSDAETDGVNAYELYTDDGTTSAEIFVTISIHE